MLSIARRGGERLLSMVNNVLDVSKAEAGRLTLERAACDAAELARSACVQLSHLAGVRSIVISIESATGLAPIVADIDKLRRVLVNLVGNAIQHAPIGSTVTVAVEDAGSSVAFSVTDRGRGIPMEASDRGRGSRRRHPGRKRARQVDAVFVQHSTFRRGFGQIANGAR